jgi:hypothetical protein
LTSEQIRINHGYYGVPDLFSLEGRFLRLSFCFVHMALISPKLLACKVCTASQTLSYMPAKAKKHEE